MVSSAIADRKKRSTSKTPPTVAVAVTSTRCVLQLAMKRERRVTSLGEAEREELVAPLHAQARQHVARGREQVDRGRRLRGGVEVAMARHRRVTEAEVVRSDVDEAATREDRARRRPVEALAVLVELAEDVRVRRRVVEGDRRAVQVDDRGEPSGLARDRDVPGGDRGRGARTDREAPRRPCSTSPCSVSNPYSMSTGRSGGNP